MCVFEQIMKEVFMFEVFVIFLIGNILFWFGLLVVVDMLVYS